MDLKKFGIKTFLETAGVRKLTGQWDWICLSPKKGMLPVDEYYRIAHELKVIIHNESDIRWAEVNADRVHPDCQLFLQPEWSRCEQILPAIVEYVKANPKWNISLQTHKYMNIP
jgi:organic radical activating enzyme